MTMSLEKMINASRNQKKGIVCLLQTINATSRWMNSTGTKLCGNTNRSCDFGFTAQTPTRNLDEYTVSSKSRLIQVQKNISHYFYGIV